MNGEEIANCQPTICIEFVRNNWGCLQRSYLGFKSRKESIKESIKESVKAILERVKQNTLAKNEY